jgi:hypothetical protein
MLRWQAAQNKFAGALGEDKLAESTALLEEVIAD